MVRNSSWITPSWLILLLDLGCSVLAINLAFLLRLNFDADAIAAFPLRKIALLTGTVTLLLSLLLHTYRGIVRFTSLADIGRIAALNIFACGIYLSVSYSHLLDEDQMLFPVSVILINFFISSFFTTVVPAHGKMDL